MDTASSFKRFVTFYITNFPPQASAFFLREGFKVCGILEDVLVARNRNMNGDVYDFVRYVKVRDVNKLLKALNNVCFGQYSVHAKLARFDKSVSKEVVRVRNGEGDGGKDVGNDGGGVTKGREKVSEGEKI